MKKIYYGKQTISDDDVKSVSEVLKSDFLTQGPLVEKFENKLKTLFGAKYCNALCNGTAALHLTGLALNWKKEDIILTSPITFLASANAILYSGAKPDFVDIDLKTYTIDPNLLEDKIKQYQLKNKKIKAVIGIDYAGLPCDWDSLRFLANKYDFQLVNDNCHAMGASYNGDKHYAVKYADVVTQSYHPVKQITTGEGGSVLTNSPLIDSRIRNLKTHGMTKDPEDLDKLDGPWYYEMHNLGYNYRITDFQCALGVSQLKKLNSFVKKRNKVAQIYNDAFKGISNITTPYIPANIYHAFHLYCIRINFKKIKLNKINFYKKMSKQGIVLQVHYIPVHLQPFYKKNLGFKVGDFPNSEMFYEMEFSLPIYPLLSKRDQNYIIEKIKLNLE